jgi:60S ribosomal protein uL30
MLANKSQTVPKTTETVPESVVKRQTARAKLEEQLAKQKLDSKKKNKEVRRTIFLRARQYQNEYKKSEKLLIRNKRTAREGGVFYVEPEAKLAFVIRIRGVRQLSPKVKKILQLLRLRQINNGVFVKINKPMLEMMRIVEPFIAWGYPNLRTVKDLIYKRGFAKINGQRIPITENKIIANHFNDPGLVSIEDLIHEIYTVGPKFKEVNKFFWTFKLSNPRGGFSRKLRHYVEGGDAGNREKAMNKLIRAMN